MHSHLILLSALGFGFAHAFEPDHMAAVSTFVAGRPSPRQSLSFGLKWATGHGLSLFLLGTFLYAIRRAVESAQPALFSSGVLDRFVGLVLIGLGLNALYRVLKREPVPSGEGVHFHSHSHPHGHLHAHGESGNTHAPGGGLWFSSVLMGLLHGAAGTGAFIGQAVAAVSANYSVVFLYTLVFSLGVLVAMGVYSFVLGGAISLGAGRRASLLRGVRGGIGVLTCGIGLALLLGYELPGLFDHFVTH